MSCFSLPEVRTIGGISCSHLTWSLLSMPSDAQGRPCLIDQDSFHCCTSCWQIPVFTVACAQVNVTNVPISLKEWSLDTRLLGRKALVASLTRHYFNQCLAEAHKARTRLPAPCPPWLCTSPQYSMHLHQTPFLTGAFCEAVHPQHLYAGAALALAAQLLCNPG